MAAKEQRLTFIFSVKKDGAIGVDLDFHPRLARSSEIPDLPMYKQQLQMMAADLGRKVMLSLQNQMRLVQAEEQAEATTASIDQMIATPPIEETGTVTLALAPGQEQSLGAIDGEI